MDDRLAIERRIWTEHFGHEMEFEYHYSYGRNLKRNRRWLWSMTIYPRFERMVFVAKALALVGISPKPPRHTSLTSSP